MTFDYDSPLTRTMTVKKQHDNKKGFDGGYGMHRLKFNVNLTLHLRQFKLR